MKKIALFICIVISTTVNAQKVSCSKIINYLESNYHTTSSSLCVGSSMLIKTEYYKTINGNYVIAYFKRNQDDIYGKSYVFCGINEYTYRDFLNSGSSYSWGKAFHKYIRNNICNCN